MVVICFVLAALNYRQYQDKYFLNGNGSSFVLHTEPWDAAGRVALSFSKETNEGFHFHRF
jgi:hypothetical protein